MWDCPNRTGGGCRLGRPRVARHCVNPRTSRSKAPSATTAAPCWEISPFSTQRMSTFLLRCETKDLNFSSSLRNKGAKQRISTFPHHLQHTFLLRLQHQGAQRFSFCCRSGIGRRSLGGFPTQSVGQSGLRPLSVSAANGNKMKVAAAPYC